MLQRLADVFSRWLPWSPTEQVLLLNVEYDGSNEEGQEALLADFRSRIQLTYRKNIPTPLKLVDGREISSDAGWGCMLRATQMMLAQCFVALVLGREWRFDAERDLASGSAYLEVVSCFLDVPTAPFSLHCLVAAGQHLLGKEPSTWFGPTSAAQAVGHLFQSTDASSREPAFLRSVGCRVFEDGAVFKDSVLELFASGTCSAAIILVCRRLGLNNFNVEEYRPGLESCFALPEFQGLASGNSASSAHFFVGTHGDCLLFLDPHQVRPALDSTEAVCRAGLDAGLHAARPLTLRWSRLNPSVCLGFLVKSQEEFLQLCDKLCEGPRSEVIEVLQRQPSYSGRVESTTEDGDMVLLD
mmetsp:Transcript_88923/g.206949  ORF Transcript_88923/g.206949 Transcript_88923/m.206949 type:complete len:356 (+) Transcript_88923:64-1131(+)